MTFTLRDLGQSQIVVTLSCNIVRPSGERKYLRYSTESEWNSHFLGLVKSLCWHRHQSTSRMCLMWSSILVSTEGSFPLITLGDVNQMVSMPKINFSIDLCLTQRVKEVGDGG